MSEINTEKQELQTKIDDILEYAKGQKINIVIGVQHKDGNVQSLSVGNPHEVYEISAMLHGYNKKASQDRILEVFKHVQD